MLTFTPLLFRASSPCFFKEVATSQSPPLFDLLDLTVGNKSLTAGDNFGEIIRNKEEFIDKSLFVREVIDDSSKAITITRPRGFGKTTNLSMLHHFLAKDAHGQSTEGLFNGLNIMDCGEDYLRHHRRYPVIYLSFKTLSDHTYERNYAALCKLLSQLYREHQYLLDSNKLISHEKKFFQRILDQQISEISIRWALKDLTRYLTSVHGVHPWLLIDEYDTPIQSSYVNHYYGDMMNLMGGMLGCAIKSNPYLGRAVMTGVLPMTEGNFISHVNNLKIYSLLHPRYSSYFGFTEEEVSRLAERCRLKDKLPEIKDWYDGYQLGERTLYNPCSIVNYMQNKEAKPYSANTSDHRMIKDIFQNSSEKFKENLKCLLGGESLTCFLEENPMFCDLRKNEGAVWNLLLMAGYLKAIEIKNADERVLATFKISNHEIKNVFNKIIKEQLSNSHGANVVDGEAFKEILEQQEVQKKYFSIY